MPAHPAPAAYDNGTLPARRPGYWHNSSGGIAMIFALMLPVLMAVIGLCTDYFHLVLIRTQLQAAVDNAAITGARKMVLSGVKDKEINASVGAYLKAAVDTQNGGYVFETSADTKDFTISVTLNQQWTPFFAHFVSADITPVKVQAKAKLVGTANVCILTLHPSASASVHLSMLARVEANDCAIYANSTDSAAIRLDLLGKLEAGLICSVGGTFGLLSHFEPPPTTDCPVLKDPLAQLPEPEGGGCDHYDLVISKGTVKLLPGVYCGGLTIKGTAKVNFETGTYVIRDEPFTVTDKASVQSKGTGFFLQGKNAVINFRKNSTIELSGQETGPMAGLLFFEERAAPLERTHLINSAYARQLTGTIYLPRGKLVIDPNAPVAADSAYTAIVARKVQMTEGPTLVLNSNYDQTLVPVPDGIRSSSQVTLTE